MTNVVENRITLYEEVNELKAKEDKHFANRRHVKEEKRLIKGKLDNANRAIKVGEEAWKKEREGWDKEKSDLTMAKTEPELDKADVEAKITQLQDDLDPTTFKLNTEVVKLKLAEE